jgi:hypothetical protein
MNPAQYNSQIDAKSNKDHIFIKAFWRGKSLQTQIPQANQQQTNDEENKIFQEWKTTLSSTVARNILYKPQQQEPLLSPHDFLTSDTQLLKLSKFKKASLISPLQPKGQPHHT